MSSSGGTQQIIATSSQVIASPAAGAEVLITVPAGVNWRIASLLMQFTTSAVVANRQLFATLNDAAGHVFFRGGNPSNFVAGITLFSSYAAGGPQVPSVTNQGDSLLFLPSVWLPPGYTFNTVTRAIDVGDQYSNITALIDQVSIV